MIQIFLRRPFKDVSKPDVVDFEMLVFRSAVWVHLHMQVKSALARVLFVFGIGDLVEIVVKTTGADRLIVFVCHR